LCGEEGEVVLLALAEKANGSQMITLNKKMDLLHKSV
jgi:hypothetical protein